MSDVPKTYAMFLGGQLVSSASGATEPIIDPSTEAVLAHVPVGNEEDVEAAVGAAVKAAKKWSDSSPKDRMTALLKLADVIDANAEELAQLESRNVGKPIGLARSEIPFISDNLRFFAAGARCLEGRAAGEYAEGRTSWIRREPVGVVASIAPWNYPLMMAAWKIGPALAAGNTVVLKPAETTPLTALRLAELAADVFPAGVLSVITGHGRPVGAGLVAHRDVDMVSLTGDVGTGKEVARAASATLKRVHLELGGKAPVLVFDDADLEAVVRSIRANAFINSGQDCTAACRVYARDSVYERLVSDLVPAVESIVLGDVSDEKTEMGSMVSKAQLSRVEGFVDRARETKRAQVVTGGETVGDRGFWYRPTVVANAAQEDEIVQREIFGPVVTVTRFDSDEDAIQYANDVRYGLASSVWTKNVDRALEASKRLRFGTVWINDHCTLVSEMPHGGFKESGYGSDMSMYSIEEYTEVKHVMARWK